MILSNLKNLSFRSITYISLILFLLISVKVGATHLIIPMDEVQKNHLKSYGIAFYALESKLEVNWLLNYRGGSFALKLNDDILKECKVRFIGTSNINRVVNYCFVKFKNI